MFRRVPIKVWRGLINFIGRRGRAIDVRSDDRLPTDIEILQLKVALSNARQLTGLQFAQRVAT